MYRSTSWDRRFIGNAETNTLGFSTEQNGTLYFAYRGSQAPRNEIDTRLQFSWELERFTYGNFDEYSRAHRGFLAKYTSIRDQVHQHVRESDANRILIVGHSGGGAVAALTFHDLSYAFPEKDVRAVAFGMPRVFNHRAAAEVNRYRDKFIRVVNGGDLVVMLPSPVFMYRHVGTRMQIRPRRWYMPVSWYDHYPGYHDVLEQMVYDAGLSPSELGLE
jgi:predicted lipase